MSEIPVVRVTIDVRLRPGVALRHLRRNPLGLGVDMGKVWEQLATVRVVSVEECDA